LFTADPYSKILDPEDRNTLLIFGDGATASVIEESDHWRIGEFDLGTDGARSGALATMPNGLLRMNGRSVFDFCALNVPGSVERALAANGLDKSRVDRFLLHPGSRYVVDTLTSRLGLGEVPFPAAAYGNTVSSSIPMMLAELDPKKDRTVLLSGFGVGMSWATTVLKGKSP
jgi:3-oxoacyl-[acyl-carrier-protein] synthase-3